MVNILLAMRLFANLWSSKKILIRCDNQAVATVLRSGKTCDSFLAVSARNICYVTAIHDIDVQYTHISGASNQMADTLSRWQGSAAQIVFTFSNTPSNMVTSVYGSVGSGSLFVKCIHCMCNIHVRGHVIVSNDIYIYTLCLQGPIVCLY